MDIIPTMFLIQICIFKEDKVFTILSRVAFFFSFDYLQSILFLTFLVLYFQVGACFGGYPCFQVF